jgi:hypothetical protein
MQTALGQRLQAVPKAQKRQSLKEALPLSSYCQDLVYFHKATQVRSAGNGIRCLDIEALPFSQTLQAACLLTFATQLLM